MDVLKSLFPPSDTDDPARAYKWRRSISAVVITIGALTVVNTWVMWGIFPVSLAFSGFASVESVAKATNEIERVQQSIQSQSLQMKHDKDELKALLLQGQLNQIFDAMCGAIRGKRREEADQWERQFTEKIIEYNRISMQVYPMRNCG